MSTTRGSRIVASAAFTEQAAVGIANYRHNWLHHPSLDATSGADLVPEGIEQTDRSVDWQIVPVELESAIDSLGRGHN